MRKSNIEGEPDNLGPATTAKASSEHSPLGAFSWIAKLGCCFMAQKASWSFAEQRRLIELARDSKSLDEVAKLTGRKPESIKKVASRLGISFKSNAEKD